jgi:hypothetical protein
MSRPAYAAHPSPRSHALRGTSQAPPRNFTEIHSAAKPKKKPKAMGHGLHGFSRIKQSAPIRESEQFLPPSLNKKLVKKQDVAGQ